ncbi:MAG: hypothetical protein NT150_10835 [Bacteroidetes bacterium]|nr:hypothetical protein [Bacteroidota bacterium]
MKTKLFSISALSAALIFLSSCESGISISKKRYSDGYYVSVKDVERNGNETSKKISEKQPVHAAAKELTFEENKIENLSAENLNAVDFPSPEKTKQRVSEKVEPTKAEKKVVSVKNSIIKKIQQKIPVKKSSEKDGEMSDTFLIVLLLTILIPPIGVFIFKQELKPTIIDLLLMLIGFILAPALGIFVFYGLGYLLGLIYGLLYIFQKI